MIQAPTIGFSNPCPSPVPCKIRLNGQQSDSNNRFDSSFSYYLPFGTIVFKDKDTGEYLFDLTGQSEEGVLCTPITQPDLPNNLDATYVDNYVMFRAKATEPNSSIYAYNTANVDIEFSNDGWILVNMIESLTINGRLHTIDVDGERRQFHYFVPANTTLSIRSTAKNIIVANY